MIAMGILLPASVLQSEWFQNLAIFVAFNTVLFATISVAHLLPAPWSRAGRRFFSGLRSGRRGS